MHSVFFVALNFLAEGRGALWYVEQCDGVARFVIGLIIVCSIASFSMIGKKFSDLSEFRKGNLVFEQSIRDAKIIALRIQKVTSPYGRIAHAAVNAYRKSEGKLENRRDVEICMGHVENAIQREIARLMPRYEKYLVVLSTFVSGGPFLGLFGTVWGVIVTFGSLTEKATISQLAPGVSGALLATLSGLALAIPALFAYNGLLSKTKVMTTELENFASLIADRLETELLIEIKNAEDAKKSADVMAVNPSDEPFADSDIPDVKPEQED